jgi:hypothetical protein
MDCQGVLQMTNGRGYLPDHYGKSCLPDQMECDQALGQASNAPAFHLLV